MVFSEISIYGHWSIFTHSCYYSSNNDGNDEAFLRLNGLTGLDHLIMNWPFCVLECENLCSLVCAVEFVNFMGQKRPHHCNMEHLANGFNLNVNGSN